MNSYWPGPLPEPSVRTLDDMRCVLANPDQSGDIPLYYMYRDLALTAGDRAYLREQNLRFDITVIPPGTVGGEYVKTKGHYHPISPSGIGYPELYQVLAGGALPSPAKLLTISAGVGGVAVIVRVFGDGHQTPSDNQDAEKRLSCSSSCGFPPGAFMNLT